MDGRMDEFDGDVDAWMEREGKGVVTWMMYSFKGMWLGT